jgi:hypothetical protein
MLQPSTNRNARTLLISLVAVMLILLVVVVWMWLRAPSQPDLVGGRAVADEFLAQVRAGRAAQAWETTTTEFKSAQGRESFLETVKKYPWLSKPMHFVSVQTVSVQGKPRAEYMFRSTETDKTVRLLAGDEQGAWRIDRIAID